MDAPREPQTTTAKTPDGGGSLSDHIDQNVEKVVELHQRANEAVSASRRRLERVSSFIARPAYLVGLLVFVALWVIANLAAPLVGLKPPDPPPFSWLEGILSLAALLTTTIVLITQTRLTRLEQQRAHLDLQVNLLTEQKVTKLIDLIEELRRDLPGVPDRADPQATALQETADAGEVLSALKSVGLTGEGEKP
jgi:uncharacterized membrane protein